jgi:hypothetical protein
MNPVDDRRGELRRPANARGVVVAPGLELACAIADVSGGGMRLRLDRNLALPSPVLVVDVAAATAQEVDVAWRKGQEVGVKRRGAPGSLRGLTPSRLTAAREAWLRAGGR